MKENSKNVSAFDVFTAGGKWIDTVFYYSQMTCVDVAMDLINHDGYAVSIKVRRA